jgi:hypothetical protein
VEREKYGDAKNFDLSFIRNSNSRNRGGLKIFLEELFADDGADDEIDRLSIGNWEK